LGDGELTYPQYVVRSQNPQNVEIDDVEITDNIGPEDVVANFSATPLFGAPPLTVNFIDESTGDPTTWEWSFGDGETSSEQNPSHIYQNDGLYTVTLIVSNDDSSDTLTQTDYIYVTSNTTPPDIEIPLVDDFEFYETGYDLTLVDGYSINKSGGVTVVQSGDSDGNAFDGVKFAKLVPNEENENGMTFKVNVGSLLPGNYVWALHARCTDDKDLKLTIYRAEGEKPQDKHHSADWEEFSITFTVDADSSTNDSNVTFVLSSYATQTVYFDKIEIYKTDTSDYEVNANFEASLTAGTAPLTVDFTDLSTGNPDTWMWYFGDGETSTEQNPTHVYGSAGTYDVSLIASNAFTGDTLTIVDYITVTESMAPPSNVDATVEGNDVTITWTAPAEKALTGYNVYRNESSIAYVTETTYTDSDLENGTYTYCVTAVYDVGESNKACADPVDVGGQEPIYEDDFDSYTSGEQLACQNPDDWTTWDLSPCSATDAYISDTYAYSGTNSVNIVDENDLVYPIADYTEGYYKLSFYMYIPSGNDGYWNVLQSFNDGNYAWGMQVLYNSTAEGQAVVDAGGAGAATFDFAYDTWMYNEVYINLYTDNAEFYVDGNLVVSWQWSTGAAGDGNLNQLGGVDLYGWTGGLNAVCNYYFDDFMLEELSFELPDPPTNVMATLADNDVTVTWEAPGSGNGSNEFADDFESGTFDAWGEVIEGSATAGGDQEPYWTIYDVDPYEGAYDASCGWGYNVDTWLITPPIEITSNTKVTFAWNSSYYWEVDPNDNGDLFVKVSTDGGTTWDALWTFGDIGEWDSWTWYETMVDLSAYAGQTVLVAFNNVGDDNAQVNLDNVFIGESTKDAGTRIVSSIPDLDSKLKSMPKDYIYDYKGVKDLLGYNVYRNDMLIGYTTEMSYYDEDLTSGTYTYCVSAVYDDGESQAICADPVTVEQPYFPAPTNLTGPDQVSLGEPIDLTWDEPGTSGWMQWDDGVNVNGIGLTNGGTFYVASHWEPSDLVPYAGMYISKIVFYYNVTTSKADFVLKVWKGANASTELLSQVITPEAEWNEIILDTPVQIDGAQDLWFGYEVTTVSGEFPAGVDAGPAVVGKGDMISLDGSSWGSLYELTGGSLDGNWNLSAYVSLTAKGAVAVPLEKTTISNPAPAEFVSVATHPVTPSFTPSEKGFTHYNIYRDGTVIGTSTETSYTDTGYGNEGVYEYYVTAVYDEGESDPSNTHVVNVITGLEENTVSGLKLYPNPARDYLNIRADAVINTVQVLNFAGQLILNESVNSSSYRINVSNLRAGVYMIRIETEEGTTTQRIVVQ
jgi:PKD repeat protein